MCQDNDKQKHNFLNEKFAIAFYRLIQTVRLHQDNNQLIKQCTAHFTEMMENILGDDKLNIFISKEQFYIQGEKLQQRKASIFIQDFLDFLIQRRVKGFVFHPAIRSASATEVLSFIRLLINSVRAANPPDWLSSKVKEQVGPWVEILAGVGLEGDGGCFRPLKERALAAYSQAQSSLKEVAQKLSLQGNAGMLKAKRLIQNMADLIKEDEVLFLRLSTIRDYDDYTYSHSVNVAVLSMCLGNRIGLSRSSLSHLGLCGLFHDLGKVEVPAEIIKKPDKLSNEEWEEMSRHPLLSVRQILNLNTSHALKSKIILAPLEHHLNFDLSGYPQMKSKKRISLFGRILHIADYYDAITSPRVYRPFAYSPDQALSLMIAGSGKKFDPILLKVFITMVGNYPVGTLLLLDSGEMGVVISHSIEKKHAFPQIVLLMKNERGEIAKGDVVDIGEKKGENGPYKRNIVKSINPSTYGIKPAEFIL